jgi:hypothetical protein
VWISSWFHAVLSAGKMSVANANQQLNLPYGQVVSCKIEPHAPQSSASSWITHLFHEGLGKANDYLGAREFLHAVVRGSIALMSETSVPHGRRNHRRPQNDWTRDSLDQSMLGQRLGWRGTMM